MGLKLRGRGRVGVYCSGGEVEDVENFSIRCDEFRWQRERVDNLSLIPTPYLVGETRSKCAARWSCIVPI